MLNPAQLRRHAELLRARYSDPAYDGPAEYIAAGLAQADLIEAKAELADAQAGRGPVVAEECRMVEQYPIIGRVTREGGDLIQVEHPWEAEDEERVENKGVMVAYEWCHDPNAGLAQGQLIRIYIGTRDDGPCAMWDRDRREWHRLRSNGNYGNRWAYGGTWSSDKIGHKTLDIAAPDIAAIIKQ